MTVAAPAPARRLADVQRVLALFVQGVAGRPLHLRTFDARTRAAAVVPADADTLQLPPQIAGPAALGLGAYRIAALRGIAALERAGFDYEAAMAAAGLPLPPVPERPAWMRGALWPAHQPQQPALARYFAATPRPRLTRSVFGIVDRLRIDAGIAARFPGARRDLAAEHAARREQSDQRAARRGIQQPNVRALLLEALAGMAPGSPARPVGTPDVRVHRVAEAMSASVATLRRPGADVHDSALAALRICALIESLSPRAPAYRGLLVEVGDGPPAPPGPAPGGPPGARPDGPIVNDPDAPVPDEDGIDVSGDPTAEITDAIERGGRPGVTTQQAVVAELPPDVVPDEPEDDAAPLPPGTRARIAVARPSSTDGRRSFLYDEWNYLDGAYVDAWCTLYEQRLRGDDYGFIGDVRRRHRALARRVRQRFDVLRPESWRRVHRVADGDEIALDGMIDAVIDRRTGHATDERLYVRRERAQREVATAFLVDMSASTSLALPDPQEALRRAQQAAAAAAAQGSAADRGAAGPDPAPAGVGLYGAYDDLPAAAGGPRRRVIDVAKDALALMCDALHALGDSHAVYGFSGSGRANVEFHVAKDFGVTLNARTWAALAAMQPRGSTRMGPAIRHAATRLARQPVPRRLLIVVSDGYPQDTDYGPDRQDEEYGIQDTARALQEAERAGLTTFCVTIDPGGHDYLRRMCAPDRYMVIDDVWSLPDELSKIYRTLTDR